MASNTVVERISESTWNRLREAQRLRVRLGEETLTDLLVLDFLASAPSNVKILPTTKFEEAQQGTDLVVYVRRGANKADIYAVQAKKLSIVGRYDHLKQRSGQTQQWQIDVLERYAKKWRAVPLYLLFNHVDDRDLTPDYWHCCQQTVDKRQFGCTLVPSWRIREAISIRGCRTFGYVHLDQAALPWRCAFDCPNNRTMWGRIREKTEESYREFFSRDRQELLPSLSHDQYQDMDFSSGVEEWPSDLWEREPSSLSVDYLSSLYPRSTDDFANRFLRDPLSLPRWLILVNSSDS